MTKRTRYFMIGSALVVVLGLCTGLVAYYSGNLPLLRPAPGPDELKYLPAEAAAVAYADVRQIMDSQFRQKIRQVLPTGEAKDEFLKQTGIDPERDIDTVVAGFAGNDSTHSAIVLIRGRFNDPQIETLARQHGATIEEYRGKRLIVAPSMQGMPPDDHRQTPGIAFLEPGLLVVASSTEAMKSAVDAQASGQNARKNAELMKLVTDVEGSGNAWAVGRIAALQKAAGHTESLPQPAQKQLAAIDWFAVSARINGGVSGMVRVEARDDKAAEDLRAVVNGGLAAARLMSGSDPKVTSLVNSLQPQGTGKTVALTFTVPPEVLDIINGVGGLHNLSKGSENKK